MLRYTVGKVVCGVREAGDVSKGAKKAVVKQDIIKMIREMPDDVTVDDVVYRLYVRSQIEAGLEEAKAGKTIPHEEVKDRLERWLR